MTDDDLLVVRRDRRAQLQRTYRRRRISAALGVLACVVAVLALTVSLSGALRGADRVDAAAAAPGPADISTSTTTSTTTTAPPVPTTPPEEALPASGDGRRVVFSIERQRMWWVDEAGTVLRTSLVSGREATPATGTFQVYSKSLASTGLDGSKMDYFVRFTKGPNGWAIGFHDIPEVDGVPVQTEDQLGQPLSHGCIRQREQDAAYTWEFLEVGDTVVVVA